MSTYERFLAAHPDIDKWAEREAAYRMSKYTAKPMAKPNLGGLSEDCRYLNALMRWNPRDKTQKPPQDLKE